MPVGPGPILRKLSRQSAWNALRDVLASWYSILCARIALRGEPPKQGHLNASFATLVNTLRRVLRIAPPAALAQLLLQMDCHGVKVVGQGSIPLQTSRSVWYAHRDALVTKLKIHCVQHVRRG